MEKVLLMILQKRKNKTAEQIVHYLCKRYGLDYSEHDAAYILKMVNMRYAMGLNSYQQWLTTVLASDVSDATAAAIMENQDSLQGVDISEDSLRRYPDGQYFASIIGYTGQISQEEYDDLSDDEKRDILCRILLENQALSTRSIAFFRAKR